eukprot:TRINITY_DN2788_c0_g1_i1.p2 TRINITY_DN2788_c0_g1~~TRINITY_DN2788_c0_g1_i1.p2  ORF type:complete len:1268 (+),score=428.35 TRINITY_DN2788_c0_g1_i1:116-3919(+)
MGSDASDGETRRVSAQLCRNHKSRSIGFRDKPRLSTSTGTGSYASGRSSSGIERLARRSRHRTLNTQSRTASPSPSANNSFRGSDTSGVAGDAERGGDAAGLGDSRPKAMREWLFPVDAPGRPSVSSSSDNTLSPVARARRRPPGTGGQYEVSPSQGFHDDGDANDDAVSLDSNPGINAALLCFLRPFFAADENPDDARRKGILVPPAMLMLCFFICFVVYEVVYFDRAGPFRLSLACVCLLVLLVFLVGVWKTKTMDKRLVGGCIAVLILSTLLSDLANVGLYDNWVLAILLQNALLVSDPGAGLSWTLFALVMLWTVVRTVEDAVRFGLYSDIPFNDNKPPREAEGWGWGLPMMVLRVGVLAMDHALTRRFAYGMRRERERLQLAVRVGEKVATALVNFDLELAEELVSSSSDVAMREPFLRLLENLRLYRPYLPAAVFSTTNDSAFEHLDEGGTEAGDADASPVHSPGTELLRSEVGSSVIDVAGSTRLLEANYDSILRQRLDVGVKFRKGSVMRAVFDVLETELTDCCDLAVPFAEIVLEQVQTWGGTVTDMRGPTIVGVWNTHMPCPRHSFHAVRCSEAVSEVLMEHTHDVGDVFPYYTSAVAAGLLATGSTGLVWQRSHYLLGQAVLQVECMNTLCRSLGVRQMLTERVYEAVRTQVTARIVDVIRETPSPFSGSAASADLINVYEVIEGAFDAEGLAHYNSGFVALRSRDAAQAVTMFGKSLRCSSKRGDVQAKRMMCIAFGGKVDGEFLPHPFARAMVGWRPLELEAQQIARAQADGSGFSEEDEGRRMSWVDFNPAEYQVTPSEANLTPVSPNLFAPAASMSLRIDDMSADDAFLGNARADTSTSLLGPSSMSGGAGLLNDLRRISCVKPHARQFAARGRRAGSGVAGSPRSPLRSSPSPVPSFPALDAEDREDTTGVSDLASSEGEEKAYVRDVDGSKWYRSEKLLGKGTFGDVWLGMGEDGALVAMKWLRATHFKARAAHRASSSPAPDAREEDPESTATTGSDDDSDSFEEDDDWENDFAGDGGDGDATSEAVSINVEALLEVRKEVEILSQLKHDNIVSYLSLVVTQQFVVINMEYVPGGSLQHLLENFGHFPMSSITRYTKDIVRGLRYLHGKNVAHRDFKPGNVLVQIDGQCKLADFGASAVLSEAVGKGVVGTLLYMSPEACRGEANYAGDIWSLGIALCQMITSKVPYDTATVEVHSFLYKLGRADPEALPAVPEIDDAGALQVVKDCLQVDPDARPTADTLLLYRFLST